MTRSPKCIHVCQIGSECACRTPIYTYTHRHTLFGQCLVFDILAVLFLVCSSPCWFACSVYDEAVCMGAMRRWRVIILRQLSARCSSPGRIGEEMFNSWDRVRLFLFSFSLSLLICLTPTPSHLVPVATFGILKKRSACGNPRPPPRKLCRSLLLVTTNFYFYFFGVSTSEWNLCFYERRIALNCRQHTFKK